jgi:hypothetical protein
MQYYNQGKFYAVNGIGSIEKLRAVPLLIICKKHFQRTLQVLACKLFSVIKGASAGRSFLSRKLSFSASSLPSGHKKYGDTNTFLILWESFFLHVG